MKTTPKSAPFERRIPVAPSLPVVKLGPDLARVGDASIEVLRVCPNLYQRGGTLVRVMILSGDCGNRAEQ